MIRSPDKRFGMVTSIERSVRVPVLKLIRLRDTIPNSSAGNSGHAPSLYSATTTLHHGPVRFPSMAVQYHVEASEKVWPCASLKDLAHGTLLLAARGAEAAHGIAARVSLQWKRLDCVTQAAEAVACGMEAARRLGKPAQNDFSVAVAEAADAAGEVACERLLA